jgi:hypothetical protein
VPEHQRLRKQQGTSWRTIQVFYNFIINGVYSEKWSAAALTCANARMPGQADSNTLPFKATRRVIDTKCLERAPNPEAAPLSLLLQGGNRDFRLLDTAMAAGDPRNGGINGADARIAVSACDPPAA